MTVPLRGSRHCHTFTGTRAPTPTVFLLPPRVQHPKSLNLCLPALSLALQAPSRSPPPEPFLPGQA